MMHHPFIPCFNRYMVECEWNIYLASSRLRWVLIDTWWNVNVDVSGIVMIVSFVLIDTWWNVNMRLLRSPTLLLLVLIDTWWNVNTFISLADTVLQPF